MTESNWVAGILLGLAAVALYLIVIAIFGATRNMKRILFRRRFPRGRYE